MWMLKNYHSSWIDALNFQLLYPVLTLLGPVHGLSHVFARLDETDVVTIVGQGDNADLFDRAERLSSCVRSSERMGSRGCEHQGRGALRRVDLSISTS